MKYDINSDEFRELHHTVFSDLTFKEYKDVEKDFSGNGNFLKLCHDITEGHDNWKDTSISILFMVIGYPFIKYKMKRFKMKYPEYLL